jgi:hypothetical protein
MFVIETGYQNARFLYTPPSRSYCNASSEYDAAPLIGLGHRTSVSHEGIY